MLCLPVAVLGILRTEKLKGIFKKSNTPWSQSVLEWNYFVYIVFLKCKFCRSLWYFSFVCFNWCLLLKLLESRMKPEPVEKLVTENHCVLLLWCAWFAEIMCIFSVYNWLLYIGDVINIHFCQHHVNPMISTVNICPMVWLYKPFTDFV